MLEHTLGENRISGTLKNEVLSQMFKNKKMENKNKEFIHTLISLTFNRNTVGI